MLARSQFLVLRNVSLRSISTSCGALGNAGRQIARKPLLPAKWQKISPLHTSNLLKVGSACMSVSSQVRSYSANAEKVELKTPGFDGSKMLEMQKQNSGLISGNRPPVNSSKYVGYWLLGTAGLIFGIVILGGLTRLTESGLSITEWKPITGALPPMSQADWEREFELYKDSPEFRHLNSNITLSEFKFIYFMEWTHRLMGRTIGLIYLLPAIYFIWKRKASAHATKRILLMGGLFGLQGFIGWWMVQSGLDQELLDASNSPPRVSQYRLATHLGAAFLLYTLMISTGLDILREAKWVKNPTAALQHINRLSLPVLTPFRRTVVGVACMVFFTSMSGAFVAGLDAGLIYNMWPKMGEGYVPSKKEMFSTNYQTDKDSSWNLFWKNMLENPTTVQFNHRMIATTTWTTILAMHLWGFRFKKLVPRSVMRTSGAVMGLATLQATLGICTLLYIVPTPLAASHQAGSLALLTSILVLCSQMRLPRARVRHLITLLAKNAKK